MIFITLGTFPLSFKRPLDAIHDLCKKKIIDEPIIVQSGYTEHSSEYFEMKPFILPDELNNLTQAADLIISHAGTGSLIKALKLNKKIITIPRLSKYEEAVDDHQLEILKVFTDKEHVLPWQEGSDLEKVLEKVKTFKPLPYISEKHLIIDYLEEYIDSL